MSHHDVFNIKPPIIFSSGYQPYLGDMPSHLYPGGNLRGGAVKLFIIILYQDWGKLIHLFLLCRS